MLAVTGFEAALVATLAVEDVALVGLAVLVRTATTDELAVVDVALVESRLHWWQQWQCQLGSWL